MLTPRDLHVLSTPPAFVLSQDQTLQEFNKARPNWLATRYVALSPNHFLVRQLNSPRDLTFIPLRRVRLALPSTLNPVVKQRKSKKIRPYRAAEYYTGLGTRRQVVASNSLNQFASAQVVNPSELPTHPRDPNASKFGCYRKGRKIDN